MRIVAIGAIPGRPRMLYFGLLDLLALVRVTGQANLFCGRLRQDNFAVFGRLVARITCLRFKRTVHESLHQLG